MDDTSGGSGSGGGGQGEEDGRGDFANGGLSWEAAFEAAAAIGNTAILPPFTFSPPGHPVRRGDGGAS